MRYEIENIGISICKEAIEYRSKFETFEQAWNECPRGDWMLCIASRLVDIRLLTLAKGHCANTVRHLMKDKRSVQAVDAAIAFGEGKITLKELKKYAAASIAPVYAITFAFKKAEISAAYATDVAAYTAEISADAKNVAIYAGYATDLEIKNQKETANICRKYLTKEVFKNIEKYKIKESCANF